MTETVRDRPNVLLFCTDEQRADYLGCMGHPWLHTPHIDRIAAEGTLFRNCFCSSPVCMAARATMFTGLTNRASGVYSNGVPLNPRIPTLPGILAEAGYRTHSVGKLHLQPWGGRTIAEGEDTRINPERRIYWKWPGHWEGGIYTKAPDDYYGFQTQDSVGGHVNYAYGDYVTWLEAHHPGAYAGYRCSLEHPAPLAIDPELHYNHWIADRAIAFLRRHAQESAQPSAVRNDSAVPHSALVRRSLGEGGFRMPHSKPFFLWCSFPDPHAPFAAVRKWSDFYKDVDIELPRHALELSPHNRSETMQRMGKGGKVFDPAWLCECIRQTAAMVSHVDEQVGRVWKALEDTGLADNTVVMFISDHGDQLGEHGLCYKIDYPFDGHMRVPFVARIPGGRRGQVVDDIVSQLDLVPTVLHMAGVPHPDDLRRAETCGEEGKPPPALPGEALTSVLRDGAQPGRRNALVEHDTIRGAFETVHMRTLVTNNYKLVFYAPLGETLLFDRRNDPHELTNLAGRPECRDLLNDLLRQLLAELARTEMPAHDRRTGA